jgi:hypothetical protein
LPEMYEASGLIPSNTRSHARTHTRTHIHRERERERERERIKWIIIQFSTERMEMRLKTKFLSLEK